MKEREISKKIKPEKSNATEIFLVMWKIKCSVGHTSVRDENRKMFPVNLLYMMTE